MLFCHIDSETLTSSGLSDNDKITVVGQAMKAHTFGTQFHKILTKHVGEDKANVVKNNFNALVERRIACLSVDDINRMFRNWGKENNNTQMLS